MSSVIVIGGGAAGMMAAVFAARAAGRSAFWKRMRNLGRSCSSREKADAISPMPRMWSELFPAVCEQSEILYSGFYSFTNEAASSFLKSWCEDKGGERRQGIPCLRSFFRCDQRPEP